MLALLLMLASPPDYVPIYEALPPRAVLARSVPEVKQISWMVGTWRCHNYSFAVGSAPARDFGVTTYRGKFVMRNAVTGQRPWLQLTDEHERDMSFITYDPLAKQWVVTAIEWPVNYGVSTGTMTDNKLVVAGDITILGRRYRIRTTYTRLSNDAFTLVNEEQRPDGSWIRDDEYDFVRVKTQKR